MADLDSPVRPNLARLEAVRALVTGDPKLLHEDARGVSEAAMQLITERGGRR
jgi:hypothetical protein